MFSDFYFFAVTDLIPYGDLYGLTAPADFCSPMLRLCLTSFIVPNVDFLPLPGEIEIFAIPFDVASVFEYCLLFLPVSAIIRLEI